MKRDATHMDTGQQPSESNHTQPQETSNEASAPNRLFIGPEGLRPFWGLLIYALVLSLLIAILAGLAQFVRASAAGAKQTEIGPATALVMEWLQFAVVFFVTWVMSRIEHRNVFDYGLAKSNRRLRWLIAGAFWGLFWLSVLVGILVFTHHLVIGGILLSPLQGLSYGVQWAIAFIGVGFFEEFLFRGYLQFTLTRCFAGLVKRIAPSSRHAAAIGFWIAASLISFGFGFSHGSNPGESPVGMLCAGIAGLVFSFSLWRTGSLWWAIAMHAAWDWAQSFLYGVADSGSFSQGHLLASHPAGSTLMSGGLTGPEGSLFVLPIMVCITLVIVFTLPKRATPFGAAFAATPEGLPSPAVNSAQG